MALSYLYPPEIQYQSLAGVNNTAGFLRVFYTQTDDRAPTYSDFGGTLNEADIVLDSDGRAVVIVDDTKTYRLEVYNRNGGLRFTCDPITAQGGGGGSGSVTRIVSTDGTVSITTSSGGGLVTYDLSTALTERPSEWGDAVGLKAAIDGDGTWEQVPVVSTSGTSVYSNGWTAAKDTAYDLAASIEMPNGSPSAVCMIEARFDVEVDGVIVKSEYGSIDPSRGMDRVAFEWKGGASEGQVVNGRLFVRCGEPLTLGIVGNILYNEECDGIIGEGGGGGGGYVAGQYIDIAADVISVTGVQPAGNYVYRNEISAQSAMWDTVSGKEDKVNWGLSGNTLTSINGHDLAGGGADYSAGQYIEIVGDVISVTGLQPSGDYAYNSAVSSKVDQSAFDDCCSSMSGYVSSLSSDVTSLSSDVTSLSSDVSSLSSTVSGLTGTYVEISSISAASSVWNSASAIPDKLDESAFTSYTSTAGQFTGVTTDGTLTGNGTTGSALGVNRMELDFDSSMSTSVNGNTATVGINTGILSGYIPTSVSSDYMQVTGMSAYAYESSNSAKLDESAFTAYTATATSFTGVTTDSSLTGDGTTGNALGVNGMELVFDSSMSTSVAGDSAIVGVDTASITAAVATSITGFIPTSESANYMQVTGMSAYQPSGDYAYNSAVSSKLDESAFTAYTATATSFTGVTTDATLTGDGTVGSALGVVRMELNFESSLSTSVNGNTASVGVNPDILSAYAFNSALSSKLDASASALFQPSGNYQPSGDYAYNSALTAYQPVSGMTAYAPSGDYADNSALGLKQDASAMTAYQEVSGMTAYQPAGNYQPSGDYAFNSSLSSKLDQSALELTGEWVSGIELSGSSYKLYAGWATEASMAQTAYYDSEGNDLNAYVHALSANSGVWNSVSAKQDTSAMSAYQEVSGMTAYQPSGDYIYASSLGIMEI